MKEIIESLFDLLSENTVKKESLYPNLKRLNDFIVTASFGVSEPKRDNLFRFNEDERLAQIESKIKIFEQNPYVGLQEGVKYCHSKLNDFLEHYHIGFCRKFELDHYGCFNVEIPVLITKKDTFKEHSVSSQIKFDLQMDILKEYGFELSKEGKGDISIPFNESNVLKLKQLLSDLGAMGIEFSIKTNHKNRTNIDRMKFLIHPDKLLESNYSFPEIEFSNNEGLNPDEIQSIISNLKQLYDAFQTFLSMENMTEICCSLMKHYHYRICKTTGFTSDLVEEYEKSFMETRQKNELIAQKEKELGLLISGTVLKEGVKELEYKLNQLIFENLGFICCDLKVDQYSVSTSFKLHTGYLFTDKTLKALDEEKIRELFECNNGSLDEETLKVLATDKNLDTLTYEVKKKLPSSNIKDFKVENEGYVRTLGGFSLTIFNLSEIFREV